MILLWLIMGWLLFLTVLVVIYVVTGPLQEVRYDGDYIDQRVISIDGWEAEKFIKAILDEHYGRNALDIKEIIKEINTYQVHSGIKAE